MQGPTGLLAQQNPLPPGSQMQANSRSHGGLRGAWRPWGRNHAQKITAQAPISGTENNASPAPTGCLTTLGKVATKSPHSPMAQRDGDCQWVRQRDAWPKAGSGPQDQVPMQISPWKTAWVSAILTNSICPYCT